MSNSNTRRTWVCIGRLCGYREARRQALLAPQHVRDRACPQIADRETLLAAAERLIRAQGPGVSLVAIATAAGVTKPILYRGVGDRDALLNALAERLAARMAEGVAALVARAPTPRDALQRLVRGYLAHAADERHLYLYVTAGGPGADRARQSLILADGTAQQFAARIAAYRTAQGVDASVATVWAYGLVGALHFVTLWWLREPDIDVDVVTDQITALLWSGLQAPQQAAAGTPGD